MIDYEIYNSDNTSLIMNGGDYNEDNIVDDDNYNEDNEDNDNYIIDGGDNYIIDGGDNINAAELLNNWLNE